MDESPDVGPAVPADAGSPDRTAGPGRAKGGSRSGRRPGRRPEPGTALNETVQATGPLSVEEVQALGSALALVLTRFHTLGTAHGDIRPATVFRTPKGPQLADGDPFRQAAIVNDSLFFVAPELLEHPAEVSPATDVYALGAVLAFAATGESPLRARSEPPPPEPEREAERPDLSAVPAELRRIIEHCLDRNPAVRPSAVALSILLAARLEEPPAAAVPVRTAESDSDGIAPGGAVTEASAGSDAVAPAAVVVEAVADAAETVDVRKPLRQTAAVALLTLAAAVVAFIAMSGPDGGSSAGDRSLTGALHKPATVSTTTLLKALPPIHGRPVLAEPDEPDEPPTSSPIPSAPASSAQAPLPAFPPTLLKSPTAASTWTATSPGHPVILDNRAGAAPGRPGAPSVASGYVMTVDVRWTPAAGATGYEVSYTGSVSGTTTVTTTGTSATLKGLFPSERLCAKVRAVNQYGASAWVSGAACVMVI